MAITTAIATILTNLITAVVKPEKEKGLSPEQDKNRKRTLRMFTAFISLISIVGTSLITGESIPVDTLTGTLETLVATAVAFFGSQGTYFLLLRGGKEA